MFIVLTLFTLFSCNNETVETVTTFKHSEAAKFTIVTSAGLGGTITDTERNVENGQSVIIRATPLKHYQFKEWTGDCGAFSKESMTDNQHEITITASKNCQVRAEFEKISYTIIATSKGGGRVSNGLLSKEQGQIATFTAKPDEGYEFSGWQTTEDNDCPSLEDSSNSKIIFTVAGDCILEAVFAKVPRTITTIFNEGGHLTSNGKKTETLTVNQGDEVKITAIAEDHYQLINWEGTCGDFGADSSTIKINLEKDCTIKAVFEKIQYTISTASSEGGSVSDTELVETYGQSVTLTATSENGYKFSGWTLAKDTHCPDLTNTSTTTLEFTVVGDCQLQATFEKAEFTISASSTEGGSVVESKLIVEYGQKATLSATPDEGYVFDRWETSENSVCATLTDLSNPTLKFTVERGCQLEAIFIPAPRTITTSADEGGEITETLAVNHGDEVNIKASPNLHYQLKEWQGTCGEFNSENTSISFTASKDCEIKAIFKKIEYTINASSSVGGTVSEQELLREYGQTVNLTAKSEEGYVFEKWETVEDTDCPSLTDFSNPTLEFTVERDCQLQAIFTPVPRTISTSANEGGEITETLIVNDGDEVTIEATVKEHYEFKGWEGTCGEFNSEDESISFTASEDCEIKAVFQPLRYTITTESSGGELSPNTIEEAEYNKKVTIEAEPYIGYEFSIWKSTGSGCPELSDPTYSILEFEVKGDCKLEATFTPIDSNVPGEQDETTQEHEQTNNLPLDTNLGENSNINLGIVQYDITTSSTVGGQLKSSFKLSQNEQTDLRAYPNRGSYVFKKWETNCSNFSANELSKNPITLKGTKNCSIRAIFEPIILNTILSEEIITTFGTSFNDDPIYSQIVFENEESYLIAFIRDARRHGYDGNLNIKTDEFTFGEIENSIDVEAFALANICKIDPPTIKVSKTFWDILSEWESDANARRDIDVIWHEFGHAILGLLHATDDAHIMYKNRGSETNPLFWYYNTNDENRNWRRAVDDLFSGKSQRRKNCLHKTYNRALSSSQNEVHCFHQH